MTDQPNLLFGTGASSAKTVDELLPIVKATLDCGVYAFDTAPSYGTEIALGKVLKKLGIPRRQLFIQTKIDAWQMQEGNIEHFVSSILKATGFEYLDSLLIHWPVPEYFDNTWNAFLRLKREGTAEKIGICNVRMRQLVSYSHNNIRPDIVQIERHPLRTCLAETDFCSSQNIWLQAYSPLCKMDRRIKDSSILENIAKKHNRDIGQIVLRWHIDTGDSPIFTSRNLKRIASYSSIHDYKLDFEDISQINSLNEDYKLYLESIACPGF